MTTGVRWQTFFPRTAFFHLISIYQLYNIYKLLYLTNSISIFKQQYIEVMENQHLRKRLYQNLSQRPLKHTFLLETQTKDPKSSQGILKPKIIHQNIGQLKQMSNSFVAMSPKLLKTVQITDKKKAMPKQVQLQKLSKQAKSIVEDGKYKNRSNLKPNQIFAFYDTFPQMIQDFFYLNRVSHPYDYQIVSYAKRNQHQYMTISSQGVTLYHDKQAEFLTKEEWLEDEKTYFKLQKIDFFNQYKLSKNFMIWKSKMKRHYMKSMSTVLSQKLFLTFQHPRKCLKQVRQISLVLEDSLPLFPSEQMEPLSWKELLESSNSYHANSLINKINDLQNKIVESLEEAIDLQIKNFKQSNKIRIEGLNSKEENKQGYVYSQEAILRKQYKRIVKLIKLAENILLQSKLELIKQWVEKLLQRLMEINESTSLKDQWITVNFVALPPEQNSSEIKWIPTQQNFVTTFTQIVNNAINCICQKHEKIINNEIFAKYRSSQDQSANKDDRYNSLKNLIEETEFHSKLVAQIEERMGKEFQYVLKQEMQLKKFADIYRKHKEITSFQAIIEENSAAEISSLVREWKQDNQQMQELPDRCYGMIRFDYSLIRKSMMNVAHDSYLALFSLLPSYLNKICNDTSTKVNTLLKPIGIIPTDETLVQFIKAVKRASEELESINDADKQTKQLLMLLQQNRTPNIQFHRNNNKKLSMEIAQLKSKTTAAQAMQNQRLIKFKKGIEESIKKIRGSVKDFVGKLEQIQFDQKDLDADTIIQKINQILIPITQLNKQASSIKMTETQLSLPETDLNEVHNLYKRAQVLSNLWKQKKLWHQFKIAFYSAHYYNFDCEINRLKWDQFNAEVSKIKQYAQDNQFLNQLQNDINEVDSQIQLVKILQSKSLNQKSWSQISDYLNFQLEKDGIQREASIAPFSNPKDDIYTIKWLRDNQICKYKQKIELITKKSQKQSHLINILAVLKNYINSLSLQFVTKKRQLILLNRNQETFQQLAQHLACLLQILNQDYSDVLMKQTKSLVKHYEYVIQILEAYCEFGRNWQKYQQLLDLTKHHSKQLSKQSKDFSNLQAAWKKIIKSIVMENWSKKMYDESSGANPNKNTLKSIYKTLSTWEQIKKGVEEFLDKKRNTFHHYFYFTDDELLAIITNPQMTLNQIVPIIYDNIKEINLSKDLDKLLSVVNIDNEELKLNRPIIVKLGSQFQEMLKNLQQQWKKFIVSTIKKVFSDFVSSNEDEILRTKIISENVTQVISAFEYITWVKLAEETYLCGNPVGDLRDWIAIQNSQIKELYSLLSQSKDPQFQKKITQLLLQATYLREKTQFFEHHNVRSLESYEWERTLKLCDDTSGMQQKIFLKALGASIIYGGQFLPSSATSFVTPQTQRNYLNLINCINQRQIGLIQKNSENVATIKSLSCFAAQNFKTFSFCSGVSFKLIDRVLSGICSQGLWACFDLPNSQQIISYIASHLSLIQKNIQQNNFNVQLSKYSALVNQTNFPVFFIKISNTQKQYLQKVPKANFRQINLAVPNLKKMLSVQTQISFSSSQIGETIADLTNYCSKLLLDSQYQQFSHQFAFSILKQFRQKYEQSGSYNKKIIDIIQNKLSPRLKIEDQNSLKCLLQAYNYEPEQKNKNKKINVSQDPLASKTSIVKQNQIKYGQIIMKDALALYDIINSTQNVNKKMVLVGERFYGKTTIVECLKEYVQKKDNKSISLNSIYFEAYTANELLGANQKTQGIIPTSLSTKLENWLILDGPLSDKYLQIVSSLTNQGIISNFGVLKEGENKTKLKIFLQTTDISRAGPNFINQHSLLYIQHKPDRIHQIFKKSLDNFLYKYFKQDSKMESKNDQVQHQVKVYKQVCKQTSLNKETKDLLISQIVGLIQKFSTKGIVKIKSVQMIYQITQVQLAYRCSKLIESILYENQIFFKDNQKINRKSIQKFALWVLVWSFSTLINPQDKQKFEKAICEVTKGNNCQQIFNSVLCPGKGFQLFAFDSPRLQNILNSVPIQGDILNNINRYSALFHGEAPKAKSKYEHQFYFDDPHNIRVVTKESILFNYFSNLNEKNKVPMAIFGQANSGKKSIIQIFNKRNEEKLKNFSIRFKKCEPYSLGSQIQKPFIKFDAFDRTYLKPLDNTKVLHISIDDVAMIPEVQPSIELLRMIINTNSIYDDRSNLLHFRQFQLSMTIDQIKDQNYQGVDFKRLLSRLFIIQNSRVTKEKLISIFTPILDNLCNDFLTSDNGQKFQVFSNKNGDNLLAQATTSVYTFVQQLVSELPCELIQDRNRKLLMLPKIKQICNVVTNICRMKSLEAGEVQVEVQKCAQMWAHEVVRVFSDKFAEQKQKVMIASEIKKHSLMHFKYNISIPSSGFIFTNLYSLDGESGSENANAYIKCEDLGEIEKQIQKIYENDNYTLPAPIITDEFIQQLAKVYRVLNMECGHLLIATPFRRSAKYIAKIASLFNKQSIYHDIESKSLNFDLHIAPSIMRDIKACILVDIDMSNQETLYQLACLMNKNFYEFSFKPQIKEKIKQKFATIYQQNMIKQNENLQISNLGKSKFAQSEVATQDTIKLIQIQNKIEQEFYQIAVDCFYEHFHVAAYVSPCSSSTTKFLNQNASITKHMQVLWYEFKDEVLFRTGQRMIEQMVEKKSQNKSLFELCKMIYNTLGEQMKNQADFLKFLSNCNRTYEIAYEQLSEQIKLYQNCILSFHTNCKFVEQQKKLSNQIQNKIQELVKQQEQISYKIKNVQQNGGAGIEDLQSEIKKIKNEKETLDIKSRQLRTSQKIYEDLQNILPAENQLAERLNEAKQTLSHIEQYSLLVQSALNYLNNYTKKQYVEQFNVWMATLNLGSVSQVTDILSIFEKVLGQQYVRVPGWQKYSQFTQLKGIHFCQNFISIPQSVFGVEPIVVKDQEGLLDNLLSSLAEKNSSIYVYSACKLMAHLKNSSLPKSNDIYQNSAREQIFATIQRQIQKVLTENKKQTKTQSKSNQKNEQKNQLNKGIIILGQNYGWQPTRNDIDILERKILRDRKTLLQNRVIIQSSVSPNITFFADKDDLKWLIYESSKRVQFGEGFNAQNNKANTILREIDIKLLRKNKNLIQAYIKVSESEDKNLENITKIQNQILQIQKIQKRTLSIIPEQYKQPTDLFLINWFIQLLGNFVHNKFVRSIEIYEFIKKCLLQLNYGRETKINKVEQIDSEILRNWQNLIKSNILGGSDLQIGEMVKFSMPIQQKVTIALIPNQRGVLDKLKGLSENLLYEINWIDMHLSSLPDSFPAEQKTKNMLICSNFVGSQHTSQFVEHFDKFYNSYGPISIIIADDCESVLKSKAMNSKFRLVQKSFQPVSQRSDILIQIAHMDVEHELKLKKNTLYEACKTTRKNVVDESEQGHEPNSDRIKDESKLKIREKLKKIIFILQQANLKKNKSDYISQLSIKTIQSRIKFVSNTDEVKAFICDCFQALPHQWELLLNYLSQQEDNQYQQIAKQIENAFEQSLEALQLKPETMTNTRQITHEFVINPNYRQIEDRIDQLPFSFNVQELAETSEPFNLEIISRTRAFNKQRYLLKKYLQECGKIVKGAILNYWNLDKQFGLWLPTLGYINKINNDYKIIKKGLEITNLLSGVDASSKEIKIGSQGVAQGQSILSIACQSFDYRNIQGISSKLLLGSVIKASRKLKIPLNKLNITWKLISSENVIEQNVCGDLCLSLNSKVFKPQLLPIHRALLPKQSKTVKLLMMVYDPTPIPTQVQLMPKSQSKKQKVKKIKTEKAQSVYIEKEAFIYQMAIKLNSGGIIDRIPIKTDSGTSKYEIIVEEPYFMLF